MYAKALQQNAAVPPGWYPAESFELTVSELTADEQTEVLAYLSQRPARTFGMIGFIRSNGIVSPHNRGTFYACRNSSGDLEGVALIGHFILFEANTVAAIEAFASIARNHTETYMMMGEQEDIQTFWSFYSDGGRQSRLYCREMLYEQRFPIEAQESVAGLRLATLEDLDLIVPVHALTVIEESGEDPLEKDPEAFRQRCARRVDTGKTWVLIEGDKLIFKAEVITDSPEVVYLEGVWVNPEYRGRGIGKRCLLQLASGFLQQSRAICLLVNEKNTEAHGFYKKVGYKLVGCYDTFFLEQEVN